MSLTLDLLRHGETERGGGLRGSLDDALTAHGWQQMRHAVAARGGWDRIISSPLQRCRLFAEELAANRHLPLSLAPGLQELHFGDWEGHSAADLMLTDERGLGLFWSDPYGFTPPNGEPVLDFSARVLAAVQRLNLEYPGQRLLVVSHGGVMRLLLARARGLPREQLLSVEAANGSLFSLTVAADGQLREEG
ncbi:phosphoglycerate/bisphosphoglycerate mutase [Pseudomonas sp. M47T1]|uniref:alpha-ribazole phosphatase family protein n=1 Tax=unclassified Pseudomonas TaxID=196821 RepID=UPI0002607E68|nr:alpha-ribazole phosphatase family protein [Pseudomonas sp. M47T1]EIK93683.1 phosphoglycerate/bisphosphoglycerate mutase [Pseudomonas sp. M47T1]